MSEIWNLSTLCRCCHADGHFKSLNLSYQGKNDVEIYENMLRETLGIFISTQPVPVEASYTICDTCILKLSDATEFKNQVLMCEQKFKFYCKNEQFVSSCEIKSEEENDETDLCNDEQFVSSCNIKSEGENNESDLCNDDVKQIDEKLTLDLKKEYSIEVDIQNPIGQVTKKDVQPIKVTDIVDVVKNANENGKEKKSEIPKKTIKTRGNTKSEKLTKNKEERKECINIYRSLIIKVDTDTGTQFSCKDCGGLYQTEKDINKHIYEVHAILLKCEYCPKQLKSFETLKNHLKLHTGKQFNCSFCPKKFASKHALKDHLNSHTKEKIYKCHLCEKEFKYNQTLMRHLKVHAGTNKKILCDLCGRSFNDQSNLNAHVRTVHEKLRPFNCKICQKTFSNQRHLRDHLKLHNDENLYKCDICDQRRSSAKTMEIHRLKHDKQFMCRFCSKIFDDARLKIEHVKTVHNQELIWMPCPQCGKIFSGRFSLNRHIDEHKGIKKFPCDVCGLKFAQKAVLNRHKFRKHNPEADTDIGKTKCDICKRSFKNIVLHMDKHNNRSCACDLCGKTYPNTSALNRHKSLKHFGKSFDCGLCDKKYLKKSTLTTHTMKVHKIKIEKGYEVGT